MILCLAALAAAAVAGRASPASHRPGGVSPGPWCGGPRWRLMTMSDGDRKKVALARTNTSIAAIAALQSPLVIGLRRTAPFELRSWRMQAVVDRYRIASNGEIILILFDIPSGKYMDAYLANPHCLGARARDRSGMIAARNEFTQHCPHATAQWQLLGATVDVSGVGFWDPVRTTRGALPNGAELRPLTNLHIDAGCGAG